MGNKTSKTTNEIEEYDEEENASKEPLLGEEARNRIPYVSEREKKKLYSNLSLTQLVKMPPIWTMTGQMAKVWNAFLETHKCPKLGISYVIVDRDQYFPGEAVIYWMTDICDILKIKNISEEEHGAKYILRRKTLL